MFICPGSKDSALPSGEPFRGRRISYAYLMGRYAHGRGSVVVRATTGRLTHGERKPASRHSPPQESLRAIITAAAAGIPLRGRACRGYAGTGAVYLGSGAGRDIAKPETLRRDEDSRACGAKFAFDITPQMAASRCGLSAPRAGWIPRIVSTIWFGRNGQAGRWSGRRSRAARSASAAGSRTWGQ